MTISKQVFAAAVANGLDPRLVATWHEALPRTPRVLVPIQVDALVVREEGGIWADCGMRSPDVENESIVPSAHSEMVVSLRAGPNTRGPKLDADLKYYQGVSGTGFFPVGSFAAPKWCRCPS